MAVESHEGDGVDLVATEINYKSSGQGRLIFKNELGVETVLITKGNALSKPLVAGVLRCTFDDFEKVAKWYMVSGRDRKRFSGMMQSI